MSKTKLYLFIIPVAIALSYCTNKNSDDSSGNDDSNRGLKDYFADYFSMGVSVGPRALTTDEADLIRNEFNSMTCENVMKMGPIHPKLDSFNWGPADMVVEFAQANGMKMRGHALCWHNQVPDWLFVDEKGDTVSKDVLLQRLKSHIQEVVSRYKGKIYAWDVVNEAISDNRDEYLRKSAWYKICGEEYIARAFEYAHEADPDALLFYNDYNEINPVKREKIFRLVRDLKASGVQIHGLGLQGHWAINEPSMDQLDSTLSRFAELGVTLHVTELDISVYPKEHTRRDPIESDSNTEFTSEREEKQIDVYKMCFDLFRKHKDAISSVTFWNISDRHSWLDNFPVPGRKDYPVLFDKDLKRKKAYREVVSF
jgi:endo-1,4-beta-xylanase